MTIGTFDMGWVVRLAAIVGTVTPIWVAPAAAQEVPETGGRNVRAVALGFYNQMQTPGPGKAATESAGWKQNRNR